VRNSRLLEQALLFTFVVHALAMLSMVTCLLPGLPGGSDADLASRAAYVGSHPWLWRLGWLPWGLTALSDLLLAVALLRTPWMPRLPAWIGSLVTAAAVVPDQFGQIDWMTRGVALARSGDLAAYAAYEQRTFVITAAWGAVLYTLGAIGWTWCFARSGAWTRALTALSAGLWPLFGFVSLGPMLPEPWQPSPLVVSAGNALGFVGLELWLVLVAEQVMRRCRPDAAHGRLARWRHPRRGPLGALLDMLGNSRFLHALGQWIGPSRMASDIRDVIYVNHLLPAQRLLPLVPEGLELQRLGPGGQHALFTHLSFRHGHFGPRLLGPLRRLMPSPVQTNWRIHVVDPRTGQRGIFFVSNAIDSTLHALAARLLSEGMPMHVLERAEVGPDRLLLEPGQGSAPDASGTFEPGPRQLPSAWASCFGSYDEFLAYCVPQDRVLSTQPWARRTTRQEIRLGIPLSDCAPLRGEVRSRAASSLVGDSEPVCFRVPSVAFRFDGEFRDAWPD
jgi:hypothetical protein